MVANPVMPPVCALALPLKAIRTSNAANAGFSIFRIARGVVDCVDAPSGAVPREHAWALLHSSGRHGSLALSLPGRPLLLQGRRFFADDSLPLNALMRDSKLSIWKSAMVTTRDCRRAKHNGSPCRVPPCRSHNGTRAAIA